MGIVVEREERMREREREGGSAFVAARKQIRRGLREKEACTGGKKEGAQSREREKAETRGQPVTNDSQILPVNLISPRIPEKC